ncbi:hypothetical protein FACS189452_06430 [Bacteroidia bacterium]|nr:hypothetical protein FACS189452_06430 [Bacteroidia bacterium]
MKNDSIEKRSCVVTVWLTPTEYATLSKEQHKTHYTMSRFIRTVLLEKSPKVLDKETAKNYKQILKLVQSISNNVNQIAKAHNALFKTKVHFSETTRKVVEDTLHIMQLWESNKKDILQVPMKKNDT